MINRFLVLFLLIGALALPQAAFAQNCGVQAEAIIKLRAPSFGSYNVWDTIHGETETHERFKSGLALDNGDILAVGERIYPDKGDKKSLLLIEIGRNGRVLWEEEHEMPATPEIIKVEPHDKGMVILANIKPLKGRPYIWMGFFDLQGKKLREKKLKSGKGNLRAHDIERSHSGKSYIIAAETHVPKSGQPGWSTLYRVNLKGAVMSDHAFVIGADNAMHDLQIMDDGDVMAVGVIDNAVGRKTGWVMRLDESLKMMWQKTYPRGAAAELVKSQKLADGFVVMLGTSLPIGTGNRAGWVMVIDEGNGEIAWQRYFSGALHFDGRDLLVNKDHMISVLMDGQAPKESEVEEHVRLLTLNPRGALFVSNAFFNGKGVDAFQIIQSGERERVIFGETRLVHEVEIEGAPEEGADRAEMVNVFRDSEGWVLTAPRVDSYEDPCKPVQREFP